MYVCMVMESHCIIMGWLDWWGVVVDGLFEVDGWDA